MEESPELIVKSLREFDNKINFRKERAEATQEIEINNIRKLLRNVVRTDASHISQQSSEAINTGILHIELVSSNISSEEKSKCYLNEDNIRLRFLRCECFDVDKAVERFILFLDFTSDIFGDYVCERQICISDFHTKEDGSYLRLSRTQFLPFRDRSGRRILVSVGTCNFHLDVITRSKILMFLYWAVSEDIETQRKGVVILMWPFNEEGGGSLHWQKAIRPYLQKDSGEYQMRLNGGIPVRIAARQMYYKDTPFWKTLSALYIFYALKPHEKTTFKANFGEHIELLYQLGSYGIPADLLPISATRTVKYGNLNAWLGFLRNRQCNPGTTNGDIEEIVDCPRSYDVVFRKGTTFRNNPGNTFYRGLIENYSLEHSKGGKKEKYDITLRIMSDIEKRNGRFLEWSVQKVMWKTMTDRDRVRKKIAAAFKQFLRTRNARQKEEINETIQTATSVLQNAEKKRLMMNVIEFNNDDTMSLNKYYSLEHVRKRRRISLGNCAIDNGSCFGKLLHPMDSNQNGCLRLSS
mmetsp:Transcript_19344/g.44986  ORF Transcript_19344/g.44986 Transcript_19344/m.44986 type:complete len:523 (+) Transcript_19344:224-1792(+)